MKKNIITSIEKPHHLMALYRYLFTEENFILGGKRLFKNITHAAQYGLRIKGVTAGSQLHKKMLKAEFQRIARNLDYAPLIDLKAIAAFRVYLWRIVKTRSADICPHREICSKCPLAQSCRRTFDARFDLTYKCSS